MTPTPIRTEGSARQYLAGLGGRTLAWELWETTTVQSGLASATRLPTEVLSAAKWPSNVSRVAASTPPIISRNQPSCAWPYRRTPPTALGEFGDSHAPVATERLRDDQAVGDADGP